MDNVVLAKFRGIHAATVVPFTQDYRLDEAALSDHIRHVTATPGIKGLLVNGHAGENFLLDLEEKRTIVRIARSLIPDGCTLVSGVNQESSISAAREAVALEDEGADGLLVFPPNSWALGQTDDAIERHHHYIRDATHGPLLIYGAPISAGTMAYEPSTLLMLASIPRIVGIKEGSWEVSRYEANMRLLKAARPDFLVLGSGDEHLLTSYLIGSVGSQVSLAAVIPEIVCALWDAAEMKDWNAARAIHEQLYPLSVAVYRDQPSGRATSRLKACLKILGLVSNDFVRPPQAAATQEEYRRLERALHGLKL
ncbi:dihydrodipicolinate synthase family protein [Microvirga pudoricolor]|uniref:dihydrodipicolinate synthase family protein n=1 Tax=Microvirga pudoricolor TaxID=2778729 RepID=UPI001951AAEB|nr:dihydrodipicolinate synthase family protein [Microvirga pudoricolor]MBM6596295.1 dihydrodipicolinate synthase family protein [Microvirga pudoricolor]